MPELPCEDDFQRDKDKRNLELSKLMGGAWSGFNVISVRREPVPHDPPKPEDPQKGCWIATYS